MEGGGKRSREDETVEDHQQQINNPNNNINNINDFSSPVNHHHHHHLGPQPACFFNSTSGGVFELGESSINRHPQKEITDHSRIGLRLKMSASEINKLELALSQQQQQQKQNGGHDQHKLHIKASNIPALSLKIGNWECVSKNKGDLVAKFYYRTKKLVWEVLYGALKKKIEIQWSQIYAINAFVDANQTSRLEVQLKEHPKLCEEVNFNPKTRTRWENTVNDFTGGQVCIFSQHTIRFPPRVLDDALAKLLQCDERLSNLTQRPFPYQNPPPTFQHHFSMTVPNYKDKESYAPNIDQPISSFVGNSSSNLPMPMPAVLKSPWLDSGILDENGNASLIEVGTGMDVYPNQIDNHLTNAYDNDPFTFQEPNLWLHPEYELRNGDHDVNQIKGGGGGDE